MEEEAPTDYGKGGYLRVAIGDRLGRDDRYVIKRKLGYVMLLPGLSRCTPFNAVIWLCLPLYCAHIHLLILLSSLTGLPGSSGQL
jgi:hypothetical protein